MYVLLSSIMSLDAFFCFLLLSFPFSTPGRPSRCSVRVLFLLRLFFFPTEEEEEEDDDEDDDENDESLDFIRISLRRFIKSLVACAKTECRVNDDVLDNKEALEDCNTRSDEVVEDDDKVEEEEEEDDDEEEELLGL